MKDETNKMPGGVLSLDEKKTTDIRLAAALMCVGFKPNCAPFSIVRPDKPGRWMQFTFNEISDCGNHRASELIGYWREGVKFIDRCPDHAFAYVMAALLQHKAMIDGIKASEDVAFIREGLSVAMLPMNATAETERKILGRGYNS